MKTTIFNRAALWLCLLLAASVSSQEEISAYYTSFDNTRIHYEVKGSGYPVLLIHGFTGSGLNWKNKPVTDSLLAHGYKTITVDLRGNGQSDLPEDPNKYADDAEARDLKGLMESMGYTEYSALGYSRGSIILASLLTMDPHCKKAVIGGMGADFTNPEWPRRIAFYNALMYDTIPGFEDFRKYIEQKGLNPLVLAAQQKEQPSTSKESLALLHLPVLVICGVEDSDNGSGRELQKLIPGAKFTEVPGTHNTASATPEFASLVLEFLEH